MVRKDKKLKTKKQIEEGRRYLSILVKNTLPGMVEACKQAQEKDAILTMHQDAFAGDYQLGEYYLLGLFIKYAGTIGMTVAFIGKNRETLIDKGAADISPKKS